MIFCVVFCVQYIKRIIEPILHAYTSCVHHQGSQCLPNQQSSQPKTWDYLPMGFDMVNQSNNPLAIKANKCEDSTVVCTAGSFTGWLLQLTLNFMRSNTVIRDTLGMVL